MILINHLLKVLNKLYQVKKMNKYKKQINNGQIKLLLNNKIKKLKENHKYSPQMSALEGDEEKL